VGQLLDACRHLKVIITSRHAPIGIAEEHIYQLQPLDMPDESGAASIEALGQVPSVACFLRNAPRVDLEQDGSDVISLCRRLDGIPLALELAARHVAVFSLAELANEVEDRLPDLNLGRVDAPERHQTLAATIDWSYDLLSREEQRVFRRLSVFNDGFSREAALEVAEATLENLTALVSHHLIESFTGPNRSRSFRMLQPIHDYARMKLKERAEESVETQVRHLTWALGLIAPIGEDRFRSLLYDERGQIFEQTLNVERCNLLAALHWAIDHADVDAALELTGVLSDFWYRGGGVMEGLDAIERSLELAARTHAVPSERYAKMLSGACLLYHSAGDMEVAAKHGSEAFAMAHQLGHRAALAEVANNLAMVEIQNRNFDHAQELFDMTLEVFAGSDPGDRSWRASALSNIACMALLQDDLPRARQAVMESLDLTTTFEDVWTCANHYWTIGDIACAEGSMDEGLQYYRDGFDQWLDERATSSTLTWLAVVQGFASCAVILHVRADRHDVELLDEVLARLVVACRITGLARPLDRPQFARIFPDFDARKVRPSQARTSTFTLEQAIGQVTTLLGVLGDEGGDRSERPTFVLAPNVNLTDKQRQTLERLVSGYTVKEIALADQVRVSTVYERLGRIKVALGLGEHATLPEVAAVAVRHRVA
jgi:predicted ATPase/DNA-binding CsgD family transcriptional regulator